MSQEAKSLEIEICNTSFGDCITFTFTGEFKEVDALEGIEEWRNIFEPLDTKVSLVWDCLKMTGFESGARVAWQKAMKEMGDRIDKVWLISSSPVIRTGAKLMSTFTKFKIKSVKTHEEVLAEKMKMQQ